MIPPLLPVTSVDELLATAKKSESIDIGNSISVTMGCGRQTKFAPEWRWIVDYKGYVPNSDYSDMITLDGFGRYRICRRSMWNAKQQRYDNIQNGEGRFGGFTKTTAKKVDKVLRDLVKNWHRFVCGNSDCYKPMPWR